MSIDELVVSAQAASDVVELHEIVLKAGEECNYPVDVTDMNYHQIQRRLIYQRGNIPQSIENESKRVDLGDMLAFIGVALKQQMKINNPHMAT